MKFYHQILTLLIVAFYITSCKSNTTDSVDISLAEQYTNAIHDAMIAEESEIYDKLVCISKKNPDIVWNSDSSMVLMASWTKYPDSYPVGDTVSLKWGEVWVTSVPELKNRAVAININKNSPDLRLQQLLGLPEKSGHTHFVEFWVKPEDMFRPSPDSEIDDQVAEINLPENVSEEYREWYDKNIIFSYYPEKFPWTRLGYTYDWGNENSEIGLSEFVIKKESKIIIKTLQTTKEYIK